MTFLFEEMAATITARRLQTPLAKALSLAPNDRAVGAAKRLAQRDFDQAPVRDGDVLVGYVTRHALEANPSERVAQCIVPLSADILVSAEAPVPEVLPLLVDRQVAFVLDGRRISGFVTPSDLNKQLARTHVYLLLASLEAVLAGLIRAAFLTQETALAALSYSRAECVRQRMERDIAANVAIDYVAELEFVDILRVVAGTSALRQALGYDTKTSFLRAIRHLPDLRNDVMHPTRSFIGSRPDGAKRNLSTLIADEALLQRLNAVGAPRLHHVDPWLAASLMT